MQTIKDNVLVSAIAATIALILLPVCKSLGGEAWYQIGPYCWILVYIVMLLGTVVSVLTKAIDILLDRCKINKELETHDHV